MVHPDPQATPDDGDQPSPGSAPAPVAETPRASRRYAPLFEGLADASFAFRGDTPEARHGQLLALAAVLLQQDGPATDRTPSTPPLPAGYTYFAQFVIHDLTFAVPRESPGLTGGKPGARSLRNARSPRLDLDALYGGGPFENPELYKRTRSAEFLIGGRADPLRSRRCEVIPERACDDHRRHDEDDLPRTHEGLAVIADRRNDENTMVSQLHLRFLLAHNALVQRHRDADAQATEPMLFARARRDLTALYQWIVLHDWLPRLLDPTGEQQVREHAAGGAGLAASLRWAKPGADFGIPREFAFAAGRFGHAMVRPEYALNGTAAGIHDVMPFAPDAPLDMHLMSRGDLPSGWTLDWRLFLEMPDDLAAALEAESPARLPEGLDEAPQRARPLAPQLMAGFGELPAHLTPFLGADSPLESLAALTLASGVEMGLPSGQAVAAHVGAAPIEPGEGALAGDLPLWVYVLEEARQQQDGVRLGRVGSVIVGETLLGVLHSDPASLLREQHGWTPAALGLPADAGLAHLVRLDLALSA